MMTTHPNLVSIIFDKWLKMCGALEYHAGKQHPYDLPILAASFELHSSVWSVVEKYIFQFIVYQIGEAPERIINFDIAFLSRLYSHIRHITSYVPAMHSCLFGSITIKYVWHERLVLPFLNWNKNETKI